MRQNGWGKAKKVTIFIVAIIVMVFPAVLVATILWAGPNAPAGLPSLKISGVVADGAIADRTGTGGRQDASQAEYWLDDLIDRISFVESSGRLNPPDGDNGKAAGPLQIHPCVVKEVNSHYGTHYTNADRRDPAKAKQIARLYIRLWMDFHRDEIAARIWNGGPRGWEKDSTRNYWRRVEGTQW